jgi:hypothetical protein
VLTTLVANPSYSDDVTINLDSTTPFVDVPVTVPEQSLVHIETITGTPQTNPGFIDSWIYFLDSSLNVLFADDDANHSASNVLASKIHQIVSAGQYVIRATSFAFVASQGAQLPTGSYLLSTNLTVNTPSPSPTVTEPTPEPSPSPTESLTPTPSPSETSSEQPSPEPSPTPSETQSQPESLPGPDNSPVVQPSPESLPSVPVEEPQVSEAPIEPNVLELPVEDLTSSDLSLVDEVVQDQEDVVQDDSLSLPESVQQIFESISSALESIPGGEQVLAAIQSVNNLGSEYTPEERQQVQQVVLGAIIVTQLANPRRVK